MFELHTTGSPTVPVPKIPSNKSSVQYRPPSVVSQESQPLATSLSGMKLQEWLLELERTLSTRLPVHRPSADDPAGQSQRREELAAKLWTAFQASPVEDGIDHPGEVAIREALQSMDGYPVLEWLKMFSVDTAHPQFAASVLSCLGRQQCLGTARWRMEVVRKALSTDAVEIRDAAAQAAESWGGPEMRDVLQEHNDPLPWLQGYILDIINDIQP